jgi:hypothetical protein
MADVLSQNTTQTYGRSTNTSQSPATTTKNVTKTPDVTIRSGSSEKIATKDAFERVTTTDSSGSATQRAGTTQTESGPDASTTVTVEGPDNRVRTVTRSGAENKSGIEFTFKVKIQNRNPVDPAHLALA